MNIIWSDKPSPFDTRNVSRVWFERSTVLYTVGEDFTTLRAKQSEIHAILDDAAYTKTGRAVQ